MLIEFEDEIPARSRLPKRLIALLLIAAIPLGTTLATNIQIGTGASVEFGQGVQKLVTCAPTVPIYLTAKNTFVNAVGESGSFKFTGVSLEGIQNTCVGYDFIIRAYDLQDNPLPLFDTNKTELRIHQSAGGVFSRSVSDGFTLSNQSFGHFDLTFNTPVSGSASVYRLTLETVPHDASMIRYAIGDTGPAGGFIFITPNTPGNSTGLYFEGTRNYIDTNVWCDVWPIDIPQAMGSAIGTGSSNTAAITSACSDGAELDANSHRGGIGYGDWFLPSSGELEAYFAAGVVNLATVQFWSSTQHDGDDAYAVPSYSPTAGVAFKLASMPLIAVRSFS